MTIVWKIVQSERDGQIVRGMIADLEDGRSLYQMLTPDIDEVEARRLMLMFLGAEGIDVGQSPGRDSAAPSGD